MISLEMRKTIEKKSVYYLKKPASLFYLIAISLGFVYACLGKFTELECIVNN